MRILKTKQKISCHFKRNKGYFNLIKKYNITQHIIKAEILFKLNAIFVLISFPHPHICNSQCSCGVTISFFYAIKNIILTLLALYVIIFLTPTFGHWPDYNNTLSILQKLLQS